jgi:hypothetical protein
MITTDELSKYECKKMHFVEIFDNLAWRIQHDGQFPHLTKQAQFIAANDDWV